MTLHHAVCISPLEEKDCLIPHIWRCGEHKRIVSIESNPETPVEPSNPS